MERYFICVPDRFTQFEALRTTTAPSNPRTEAEVEVMKEDSKEKDEAEQE